MKYTRMCGDCHVQPALWFSHNPNECEDTDCTCEPQCNDCLKYYAWLLKWVQLVRNTPTLIG